MDPDAARHLAVDLMQRHGLGTWRFRFDHAKRRLGSCHYTQHTITLSRPLVILNDEPVVRDTVLHEIAHALTPGAGHGPAWRRMAVQVGAEPQRCAEASGLNMPPARYFLVCDGCRKALPRYRKPRQRYVCRSCWARFERGAGPRPAPLRLTTNVQATLGFDLDKVSGTP